MIPEFSYLNVYKNILLPIFYKYQRHNYKYISLYVCTSFTVYRYVTLYFPNRLIDIINCKISIEWECFITY